MTDLLTLIGCMKNLKKVAGSRGGEWAGPCPQCGGRDRFHVLPNLPEGGRWFCRQCSPRWGDAASYLQWRDGLSYPEACRVLGLQSNASPPQSLTRKAVPLVAAERAWGALTDPGWQSGADAFVNECIHTLANSRGHDARTYLHNRGLTDAVISDFKLGFNDRDRNVAWGRVNVWLPRGIVIPWHLEQQYWRIKIRVETPASPEKRYVQALGGANGLYLSDGIRPGAVIVLVEGELDALSVQVGAGDVIARNRVWPVATGSTEGSRSKRWVARLALADQVLLAFDDDKAGTSASSFWLKILGRKAQRLKPLCHDVNDMLTQGDDVCAWIRDALL